MRRLVRPALAVLAGAVVLTAVGAVAGGQGPDEPSTSTAAATGRGGAGTVERLQQRLADQPGDVPAWAALGNAYVEQARVTGDPSYYGRAEQALARSLQLQPAGNADALTGRAALAAARHDFADALRLAEQSLAVDSFNPPALGILGDALVELGRYDEAFAAVERLNASRPGFAAYSRASYAWELRGDPARATEAMTQALSSAADPGQRSFATYQLGQLAFSQGDLDTADRYFADGLRTEPGAPSLLAGRARVAAARGLLDAALQDYTASVRALPDPAVVAELADLYSALGREADAQEQQSVVRATQRLLAAGGQDVDSELALFDADHGRPAEAVEAARTAYSKRRSVFTADALAWSLHRAGRSAEALPYAREALRLGTRSAPLHYHLGMVLAALGDAAGARAGLERALAINPHFSPLHVPVAQAELRRLSGAAAQPT